MLKRIDKRFIGYTSIILCVGLLTGILLTKSIQTSYSTTADSNIHHTEDSLKAIMCGFGLAINIPKSSSSLSHTDKNSPKTQLNFEMPFSAFVYYKDVNETDNADQKACEGNQLPKSEVFMVEERLNTDLKLFISALMSNSKRIDTNLKNDSQLNNGIRKEVELCINYNCGASDTKEFKRKFQFTTYEDLNAALLEARGLIQFSMNIHMKTANYRTETGKLIDISALDDLVVDSLRFYFQAAPEPTR